MFQCHLRCSLLSNGSMTGSRCSMKFSLFVAILALALAICNCQSASDLLDAASAEDARGFLEERDLVVTVHSLTPAERRRLRYLRNLLSRKSSTCDDLRWKVKNAKDLLALRTSLYKKTLQEFERYERCIKEKQRSDPRCKNRWFYWRNKQKCKQRSCGNGSKILETLKKREYLMEKANWDLQGKTKEYNACVRDLWEIKEQINELLEHGKPKPSNEPRYKYQQRR